LRLQSDLLEKPIPKTGTKPEKSGLVILEPDYLIPDLIGNGDLDDIAECDSETEMSENSETEMSENSETEMSENSENSENSESFDDEDEEEEEEYEYVPSK
jgi:hypothetical protein